MKTDENICPRCHAPDMRPWNDLTADEKMLAEKLPGNAEFRANERKKHRFCTRCWFEENRPGPFAA